MQFRVLNGHYGLPMKLTQMSILLLLVALGYNWSSTLKINSVVLCSSSTQSCSFEQMSKWLLAYHYGQPPCTLGLKQHPALVCTWMCDHSGMSISADSPSDETLNRGPLALLLRRQYEFPFGINIVQFSIFFQSFMF